MTRAECEIRSESNADDRALESLADVVTAAPGPGYRVIGGHMVRLLRSVYGLPGMPRVTADADAGIDTQVAVDGSVHRELIALGYVAEAGNHYPVATGQLIYSSLPARGQGPLSSVTGDSMGHRACVTP